jgi:hypothetical protein
MCHGLGGEYPYCTPAAEVEALIRDGFVPNDPTYTRRLSVS